MRVLIAYGTFILAVASASHAEGQLLLAPRVGTVASDDARVVEGGSLLARQVTPTQQPLLLPRPRRLGSMVGYIEDAIIESKIRVRFDAALENFVPDRAEFFYAKCGCYADLPPGNPAFDPEAPGPRPGAASEVKFQQLYVSGEYAFSPRLSGFGQFPVRWLQPQAFIPGTGGAFPNQSGVGDIRAGVKAGVVANDRQSVTGQLQLFLPTGDASRGLGTDHASVEPMLIYYQGVNEVVALESQFGVWIPFGGAEPVPTQADGTFAGDVLTYGVGSSFSVYTSDEIRFAPVVELVGWRVLNGYQTADVSDASGINIVNLKLGARTVFSQGSVYFGYGLALTDQSWYDDVLRFEYRYEF
jgi:hypothetical protein